MNDVTPAIRNLARDLIHRKAERDGRATGEIGAGLHAVEALRAPLSALSGEEGFRSLLSRALVLARPGAPPLAFLRIHSDGSVEGADAIPPEMDGDAAEGGVALLAELLALLMAFIGEQLTVQVLRVVWPEASLEHKGMEKETRR
jgi:hypothetical protein